MSSYKMMTLPRIIRVGELVMQEGEVLGGLGLKGELVTLVKDGL